MAPTWKYAFLQNQMLPVAYYVAEERAGINRTTKPIATDEA